MRNVIITWTPIFYFFFFNGLFFTLSYVFASNTEGSSLCVFAGITSSYSRPVQQTIANERTHVTPHFPSRILETVRVVAAILFSLLPLYSLCPLFFYFSRNHLSKLKFVNASTAAPIVKKDETLFKFPPFASNVNGRGDECSSSFVWRWAPLSLTGWRSLLLTWFYSFTNMLNNFFLNTNWYPLRGGKKRVPEGPIF